MKKNMLKFFTVIVAFLCFCNFAKAEETGTTGFVKINDTVYLTLNEAVANSKKGDTITLINDIDTTTNTGATKGVLEFNENSTLDLNNHTINTNNMDLIYTGINLTIKNGLFTTKEAYALFIGDDPDTDNVLVENVKTTGGINVYNATNVTLKDVDAVGAKYYTVWADQHALITILSGNYSHTTNCVLGITSTEGTGSYIHVMGGTFTANNSKLALPNPYTQPVIYGGIFNTDPTSYKVLNAKTKTLEDGKYEVYFEKVIDIPEMEEKENVEDVAIGISDKENTTEVLNDALDKLNIMNVNSKVVINNDLTNPSDEVQAKITNSITNTYKDAKVANYFDININVINTDTNNVITNITELDKKIKFKILIPTELKNTNEKVTRKYYIIRMHDNKFDVLDATLSENGNSLEFLSDKFSIYALAYVDEIVEENKSDEKTQETVPEKEPVVTPADNTLIENPRTFDGVVSYIIVLSISLTGVITTFIYLKKKAK